jgi:hypothetical protein
MGEKRKVYRILMGIPEAKNHWEYQDVGGWTILKWNFGMAWIGLIWLRIGTSRGLL